MITLLGWLSALVALLTGLAMLKDTYLTLHDRAELRAVLSRTLHALRSRHVWALEPEELARIVRLLLRVAMLLLVVASSGVCVFGGGLTSGLYEVLLRCGLAAFLAMQTPCPWWRYIAFGERRHAPPRSAG